MLVSLKFDSHTKTNQRRREHNHLQMNRNENVFSSNTIAAISEMNSEQTNDVETCCDRNCCNCFTHWWNWKFPHQRFIAHTVEKTSFHVVIVLLVLFDCVLVVGELLLDFILLNEQCERKNTTGHGESESSHSNLELAIEILHYGSIALLGFFVFEVTVKIYAFGKKWWNIREKKMEWLDALIVIVSFVVDIYFLKNPNVIGEISLLFISFRLWRIIRIINSVAQSIRSKDETAKKSLAEIYTQIIDLMMVVSTKKTEVLAGLRTNFSRDQLDRIIEKFNAIDNSCRATLERCPKSSSRHAVTDLAQHLQDILEEIRQTSSKIH